MRVNVPGTIWLGNDELLLLSWLAQAQQVLGYTKSFHSDATLTLAVVHSAGTLNALGIQLPPLTLQHATLVEEAELLSRRERRVRRWLLSRVRNPEPASPVGAKC
ncbi:hypothetical protein [Novosphingobium kaempferiae]|uniref:hypothetical protein n=1 Tax=Novosphingobium kaempferiae TaxID=2896849 RepID=UPI001E61FB9B|nr:hypothetical protein [Novosphingobium kaempferiae]